MCDKGHRGLCRRVLGQDIRFRVMTPGDLAVSHTFILRTLKVYLFGCSGSWLQHVGFSSLTRG